MNEAVEKRRTKYGWWKQMGAVVLGWLFVEDERDYHEATCCLCEVKSLVK